MNLVKTSAGPWNFQFLLENTAAHSRRMPAIKMRSGRVNFKFGDTKSVVYFDDADFDVSPWDDGSLDLRFSGAPSRTDRSAQNFGHFFVRGDWRNQRLDMRVELERSAVDEVARLFGQSGFGLHGIVAFDARLYGPPSALDVTGQLQVDDIHLPDLLPKRGGGWGVSYKGTLDLHGETLDVASTSDAPNPPLALRFRAWDFLSAPHWDAAADLNQIPLAALIAVVRHIGAALPEKLAGEGSVSGSVHYGDPSGPAGRIELENASLTLPDAQPLSAASAVVSIENQTITLDPSTIHVGENESARVEGSYALSAPAGLEVKISTRGLSVADLRSFGLAAIPVLDQTPVGTWRGTARYRWGSTSNGETRGEWSGEYELQNARIAVDGLADPVRIQSAAVSLNGARVAVSRLRAKAGQVSFTGEYRWEPGAVRSNKFNIVIPEADSAELERLWTPALGRDRGFLARTLRLGSVTVPDWLKARRADGTVSIDSLTAGDSKVRVDTARVIWDGASVRLAGVKAEVDQDALSGELSIDLTGRFPRYHFEGKLQDVVYAGGKLDFEGTLDADGLGAQLLTGAHAEGKLNGRSIAFTPDADFRTVAGFFEMLGGPGGPRWKFTGLEVSQGTDSYSGTGATQADGRIALDLANHGRQVRYTSPSSPSNP
ncbi:MAG: hypothetical protein ABSB35_12365 [Bryobacteraceae bacterium]